LVALGPTLEGDTSVSTVLAAIDGSPVSRAVLDVAGEVARVLDARVDAVHVDEGHDPPAVEISSGQIPLRVLQGDPSSVLIAEASAERVAAIVLGACREVGAATPAGHVSLDVVGNVPKPVVVVPPSTPEDYRLRTVLIPVLGKPAEALEDVVIMAGNPDLHVVVLRALDELSIPSFEDQPHYDMQTWADEFLARWVPGAARDTAVEVRIGAPEELIVAVAQEVCADIVAIGRRRDVPTARSPLVLSALEHSPIPVVLLPIARRTQEPISSGRS
jgi:nucleotide-binding universal stress UspA family protein